MFGRGPVVLPPIEVPPIMNRPTIAGRMGAARRMYADLMPAPCDGQACRCGFGAALPGPKTAGCGGCCSGAFAPPPARDQCCSTGPVPGQQSCCSGAAGAMGHMPGQQPYYAGATGAVASAQCCAGATRQMPGQQPYYAGATGAAASAQYGAGGTGPMPGQHPYYAGATGAAASAQYGAGGSGPMPGQQPYYGGATGAAASAQCCCGQGGPFPGSCCCEAAQQPPPPAARPVPRYPQEPPPQQRYGPSPTIRSRPGPELMRMGESILIEENRPCTNPVHQNDGGPRVIEMNGGGDDYYGRAMDVMKKARDGPHPIEDFMQDREGKRRQDISDRVNRREERYLQNIEDNLTDHISKLLVSEIKGNQPKVEYGKPVTEIIQIPRQYFQQGQQQQQIVGGQQPGVIQQVLSQQNGGQARIVVAGQQPAPQNRVLVTNVAQPQLVTNQPLVNPSPGVLSTQIVNAQQPLIGQQVVSSSAFGQSAVMSHASGRSAVQMYGGQ